MSPQARINVLESAGERLLKCMEEIVGLKELRQNLDKYTNLIQKGKVLIVVKRSKPIFRLEPIEKEEWEEVMDFTKIRKGGVPIKEILFRL